MPTLVLNVGRNMRDALVANLRPACRTECGHFGAFGGRFVPETLMPLILEL